MITFIRHKNYDGTFHCIWWACTDAGEEVFAWFWAQVAIATCLKALHAGDAAKAEVMPLNPPWENSRW